MVTAPIFTHLPVGCAPLAVADCGGKVPRSQPLAGANAPSHDGHD